MAIEKRSGQPPAIDQGSRESRALNGNRGPVATGGLSPYDLLAVHEMLRREAQVEQDVPAHEGGLTSSVGALWPPERASFERIKGIYTPGIVETPQSLNQLLEAMAETTSSFREGGITRVSLRAVIDRRFLDMATAYNPGISALIEAQFILDGTQAIFEGKDLLYLGQNHNSRSSDPSEIRRFRKNLEEAMGYGRRTPYQIMERVTTQGYRISILPNRLTEDILEQLSKLYSRFGWSRDEVAEMLRKKENIIAVASRDGQIVSAGIAEMVAIPIGSNQLRIAEITEAATLDGHGGQGLYTAVSTSLMQELAGRSRMRNILGGEIDVVYGECNGNAPGVLRTARIQGRTFSAEHGNGILSQHVPIAGLPIATPYNDLFPAYLTRRGLYTFTR